MMTITEHLKTNTAEMQKALKAGDTNALDALRIRLGMPNASKKEVLKIATFAVQKGVSAAKQKNIENQTPDSQMVQEETLEAPQNLQNNEIARVSDNPLDNIALATLATNTVTYQLLTSYQVANNYANAVLSGAVARAPFAVDKQRQQNVMQAIHGLKNGNVKFSIVNPAFEKSARGFAENRNSFLMADLSPKPLVVVPSQFKMAG